MVMNDEHRLSINECRSLKGKVSVLCNRANKIPVQRLNESIPNLRFEDPRKARLFGTVKLNHLTSQPP